MLMRVNTIIMALNASINLLFGMGSEPVEEDINCSSAVICIEQNEKKTEDEIWQACLYDALVKNEQKKVIALLSRYNCMCNAPDLTRFSDNEGRTFLMLAVVCGKSFKSVRLLLQLVDKNLIRRYINLEDAYGHTALDYAAHKRCMRILYYLASYADQKTCRAIGNYFISEKTPEERAHINRHGLVLCLSKLSEQNPSDDEDDVSLLQPSLSSSLSSD